jgi:hypothetical protein
MMASQSNDEALKVKEQDSAGKNVDQRTAKSAHARSDSDSNQIPVLNLGSLPSPPAPDPLDKITSPQQRSSANPVEGTSRPNKSLK